MRSFRGAARLAAATFGAACACTVGVFGELSLGALLTTSAAGLVVAGAGLARRTGAAAAPVGPSGLPWLAWLTALGAWESYALASDDVPTLSDLLDPVLADPVVRSVATAGWLALGAWLLTRPRHEQPR